MVLQALVGWKSRSSTQAGVCGAVSARAQAQVAAKGVDARAAILAGCSDPRGAFVHIVAAVVPGEVGGAGAPGGVVVEAALATVLACDALAGVVEDGAVFSLPSQWTDAAVHHAGPAVQTLNLVADRHGAVGAGKTWSTFADVWKSLLRDGNRVGASSTVGTRVIPAQRVLGKNNCTLEIGTIAERTFTGQEILLAAISSVAAASRQARIQFHIAQGATPATVTEARLATVLNNAGAVIATVQATGTAQDDSTRTLVISTQRTSKVVRTFAHYIVAFVVGDLRPAIETRIVVFGAVGSVPAWMALAHPGLRTDSIDTGLRA